MYEIFEMASVTKHQSFKEGETHPFRILNKIDLSDDDYFVLADSDSKKYLLASEYYSHYGFEIGQDINCRIDKISCTGKIYLEPINPFYSPGGSYDFKIAGETTLVNSQNETERHLIVIDLTGNKQQVWIPSSFIASNGNTTIKLRVAQIKKGNLLLVLPSLYVSDKDYTIGDKYQFNVEGIATLIEEKEYFRLRDEKDQIHFLRSKFYKNYNLSIGQSITAHIVKIPKAGSYYIEPLYPGYEMGKSYFFKFVKEDTYLHPTGKEEDVWIVHDKNERKCILFLPKKISDNLKTEPIRAIVDHTYKGKLYLKTQ